MTSLHKILTAGAAKRSHDPRMHVRLAWLSWSIGIVAVASCAHAAPTLAPRADDVGSVDGVMRAFYEVVNVRPDEPRQWARDPTLYSPWIHFVAIGKSPSGRHPEVEIWTHAQLVDATEPLIARGFRERELRRTTRRYGNVVHVDSTYETIIGAGTTPPMRGMNSLELYFDGTRWWIASVMWQAEDAAHPLPAELLPAAAP